MNNATQIGRHDYAAVKNVKKMTTEKEFFYNVIAPDAAIFIIGLTTAFGTILNVFA